jgi:hypothetical protein
MAIQRTRSVAGSAEHFHRAFRRQLLQQPCP